MKPDLRSVPGYARPALEKMPTRPRRKAGRGRSSRQGPDRHVPCLPAFARLNWAVAILVLFALAGCARSAAAPASPPAAGAAAVSLLAAVDELAARVARLDPDTYTVPVGLGCAAACDVLGVKGITYVAGEARCTCRRLPSLGVGPKVRRNPVVALRGGGR